MLEIMADGTDCSLNFTAVSDTTISYACHYHKKTQKRSKAKNNYAVRAPGVKLDVIPS